MPSTDFLRRSETGFTLFEVLVASIVIIVLFVAAGTAVTGVQEAFAESQAISRLNLRAQQAMERIVATASQAVTLDTQFAGLRVLTGSRYKCLRFRMMDSVTSGVVSYDDDAVVFIYGVNTTPEPCQGIVICRGPDLASIHAAGKGPDGILGTNDDNTATALSAGRPAVELLIPSDFAPRAGDMFTVDISSSNRLLTFTLRLNARDPDGEFVLENDLVLSQRVALRQ